MEIETTAQSTNKESVAISIEEEKVADIDINKDSKESKPQSETKSKGSFLSAKLSSLKRALLPTGWCLYINSIVINI